MTQKGIFLKYGVVVAILVDSGLVVDFEVLSLYCHECKLHKKDDRDQHKLWKESHKERCQLNYKGSSGGMEGEGAIAIFKRSIDTRKLKYTIFVGDGDSDTFKVVKESIEGIYGERYHIRKEECIGHIQKRMGTALRHLTKDMRGKKMSDGKGVGGKGRLTQVKINQIQRYYGMAIRQSVGDVNKMHNAIWAIFHHTILPDPQISLENQHKFCPKSESTWCKFWADRLTKKTSYNEKQRLPLVFSKAPKPIFERLSRDQLLERCQLGLTQNANESFNSTVCMRCPKEIFCGKRRITLAVSEAICVFNSGAGSKASMMNSCGIREVGRNSFDAMQWEDNRRLKSASRKVSGKYKMKRWKRSTSYAKQKEETEKHYKAGGFDHTGNKVTAKANEKKVSKRKVSKPAEKVAKIPCLENSDAADTDASDDPNIQISFLLPVHIIQPWTGNSI